MGNAIWHVQTRANSDDGVLTGTWFRAPVHSARESPSGNAFTAVTTQNPITRGTPHGSHRAGNVHKHRLNKAKRQGGGY